MRYTEILQELFDPARAFELEWIDDNNANAYDRQGRTIDIMFSRSSGQLTGEISILDIEFFRGGTHAITGQGDASLVLGTVIAATKEYLSNHVKPDYIVFLAKEPSRIRLYQSMVRRLAATIGYTHIPSNMLDGQLKAELGLTGASALESGPGLFVLKRKDMLDESLTSVYPYERSMDGAAFRVDDGGTVFVQFDELDSKTYDFWTVSFYKETASHRRTFDQTNEGDAFKILATVLDITRGWVNRVKPEVLLFSAERKRGRLSVYKHMIQRSLVGTDYRLVSRENIRTQAKDMVMGYRLQNLTEFRDHEVFLIVRKDQLVHSVQEGRRKKVKEQGLTFMGYPCTKDCSGHSAGYDWANRMDIQRAEDCPYGSSNSFWEGCKSKAENNED